MALDLAELQVVSREVIDPEVKDLVERTPMLYNMIPKGGEINSRGVFLYGKDQPNPAIGWFAEGASYPIGSNSQRIKMNATFARVAITSRLTRDSLEGANKETIVNTIAEEVSDDTKSMLKEISQQLYGDGSAVKGVVVSNSTTSVTFRVGISDLTPDVANYANSYGTYNLLPRGRYNFISGDASADREAGGGSTTRAVGTLLQDGSSGTVYTLASKTSGSVGVFDTFPADTWTLVDGDMIVNEGSYGIALKGLDYHIDSGTGTYQNVSRNTYSSLRCYVLNASNSALSVVMLYKIIFQARYIRRNNLMEGDYVILSAPTQTHSYALLGDISVAGVSSKTTIDTMPDGKTLDYGFKMFKFAGINWVEDVDCPPHKLFLINFAKFKIHEFKPLSKVFDGSGFMPVPASASATTGGFADSVLYVMTWKGQLCSKDPATAGVKLNNLAITGLAVPTASFSLT